MATAALTSGQSTQHHHRTCEKYSFPTSKPNSPTNQQGHPTYITPNDDKCDETVTTEQPIPQTCRHSLCLLSPCGPASIAIHALYHVINLAFNSPPVYTIPRILNDTTKRFQHNINIKKVCNSVVQPITKKTITKYNKLMKKII